MEERKFFADFDFDLIAMKNEFLKLLQKEVYPSFQEFNDDNEIDEGNEGELIMSEYEEGQLWDFYAHEGDKYVEITTFNTGFLTVRLGTEDDDVYYATPNNKITVKDFNAIVYDIQQFLLKGIVSKTEFKKYKIQEV